MPTRGSKIRRWVFDVTAIVSCILAMHFVMFSYAMWKLPTEIGLYDSYLLNMPDKDWDDRVYDRRYRAEHAALGNEVGEKRPLFVCQFLGPQIRVGICRTIIMRDKSVPGFMGPIMTTEYFDAPVQDGQRVYAIEQLNTRSLAVLPCPIDILFPSSPTQILKDGLTFRYESGTDWSPIHIRWNFRLSPSQPRYSMLTQGRWVRFPGILVLACLLILPGVWVRRKLQAARVRRRYREGLCIGCGYDIRGSPGACPECGAANLPGETPA